MYSLSNVFFILISVSNSQSSSEEKVETCHSYIYDFLSSPENLQMVIGYTLVIIICGIHIYKSNAYPYSGPSQQSNNLQSNYCVSPPGETGGSVPASSSPSEDFYLSVKKSIEILCDIFFS